MPRRSQAQQRLCLVWTVPHPLAAAQLSRLRSDVSALGNGCSPIVAIGLEVLLPHMRITVEVARAEEP